MSPELERRGRSRRRIPLGKPTSSVNHNMDRGRVQASSLRLLLLFLACGCHVRVASAAVAPPPPPSNRASGVRSAGVSTAREPSVCSRVRCCTEETMAAHALNPALASHLKVTVLYV